MTLLFDSHPDGRELLAAMALVLLSGCKGECVTVSTDCAPLYSPTFDNVFSHTLSPTCASVGSSCHSASGGKGGLVFDSADHAYGQLVGVSGPTGRERVIAGDPHCSLLVEKIESTSAGVQMPPGSPLSAAEKCAIEQWIGAGAKR